MKKEKAASGNVFRLKTSARTQGGPASALEARVWKVLDEARQRVKAAAKKEIQGEKVSPDLFNFRLKGQIGGRRTSRI